MTRIALDRAEFVNAVNGPADPKGSIGGTDTVYLRSDTTRRRAVLLWRDGDTVIIENPESGNEVHVPWAQTKSVNPTRAPVAAVKKTG